MRHLTILAILVGTAHADTQVSVRWGEYAEPREPALIRLRGVEDGAVDRVTIDLHGTRATLRFRISTRERGARDLHVPIELAAGTRVTGFTYGVGGEPAIEAITRDADEAFMLYSRIVERQKDPALLRLVRSTEKRAELELAIFPVSRGMPATVVIEMALPPATKLVLDPGPRQKQRTFALTQTEEPRPREYVDGTTSLFAGDEIPQPARIEQRARQIPIVHLRDRRFDVRVAIREHATQLAHCYAFGVARDATLSAAATLAIDIAEDGSVTHAEVTDYSDADVRWCIEDEIRSWQFAAADHTRRVRQEVDLSNLD